MRLILSVVVQTITQARAEYEAKYGAPQERKQAAPQQRRNGTRAAAGSELRAAPAPQRQLPASGLGRFRNDRGRPAADRRLAFKLTTIIRILFMAEITAATVGKLREMTNAGLMDCKKALTEANGDMDQAVDILRKKGVATAAKKAGREANEGVIAQYIQPGAQVGVLVEVNCETDFVAKNEKFRAFCDEVARTLAANPKADLEPTAPRRSRRLARTSRFRASIAWK